MLSEATSALEMATPVGQERRSSLARTRRPLVVVVAAMSWTMASWLTASLERPAKPCYGGRVKAIHPNIVFVLGAALLALGLAGCIRTPRAIAASTLPLEQGKYTVVGEAADSDCAWALFALIPISSGNQTQEAIKDAIASAGNGADALVQVTVDTYYQNWIVVSRDCTEVRGVAVRQAR
jgi:hypothetical protein